MVAVDNLRATVRYIENVVALTPFMVAGLVVALFAVRGINALALGEDLATAMGVQFRCSRAARFRPVDFARYRAESADAIIILRSAAQELFIAMP